MKYTKLLVCVLVLKMVAFVESWAGEIEKVRASDLRPAKEGMPGEQEWSKEIVISPKVKFRARIEVTNKGNGALKIANLNLHVVDSHNNGVYYEDEMLSIDFIDLDGDGKREIVISGIVCFTGEKGDIVLRREAAVFIYALQPNRTFKQIYRNTEIRLE